MYQVHIERHMSQLTSFLMRLRIDSLSSLQQQKSLMFNPNALIGLAQKGMPRVVEISLDSRREIDFQIKKVCEEFINHCVDGAVEPLTAFLIKVMRVRK